MAHNFGHFSLWLLFDFRTRERQHAMAGECGRGSCSLYGGQKAKTEEERDLKFQYHILGNTPNDLRLGPTLKFLALPKSANLETKPLTPGLWGIFKIQIEVPLTF